MRRWETYLFITALAAGLTGAPFAWGQQGMPKPPVPPIPAAPTPPTPAVAPPHQAVHAPVAALTTGEKVNVNVADEAGLMSVKGIGKAKAKAIIEYRQKNGLFKSIDDLTKVKGIKGKTLEKFKDKLTVG
jgi:competence ComEA-like helix-hairpin-helix protein